MNAACVFLYLSTMFAFTFASDFCYDGGKRYKPGDKFVAADCSGYCTCKKRGGLACVSLCPPFGMTCRHDEVKVQSSRKVLDSDCSCQYPECVKKTDFCHDGGKRYKPGDKFVAADCSGYCTCEKRGGLSCVSLCPPFDMTCRQDEVKVQSSQKVLDSDCSCQYPECVKKTDFCYDGGKRYKPGDKFVAADCSSYCTCEKRGGLACKSLCPLFDMTCRHDEVKVQSSRKVLDSDCFCQYPKCVKKTVAQRDLEEKGV